MPTNLKNKPILLVVLATKKVYVAIFYLDFSKLSKNTECYLQYLSGLPQQPDKKNKIR